MVKNPAASISMLMFLACWGSLATGRLEAEDFRPYAELPIEAHLLVADNKLNAEIAEVESRHDPEVATRLREAKGLLTDARQRYDFYRTNGAGDAFGAALTVESPLSLLQHLWLAADAAAQLRSRIMATSDSGSAPQAELNQSLDKIIMLLEQAIKVVETDSAWIVHWLYEQRTMISLPSAYTWSQPLESDLLRLVREDSQGETTGLFYIRPIRADTGDRLDAADFREEKIADLRRRFPDMKIVEMGEPNSEPGFFTSSFSYRYSWEGEPIHGMVHIDSTSNIAFEINCVAPVALFDQQEADRIIGSFFRL